MESKPRITRLSADEIANIRSLAAGDLFGLDVPHLWKADEAGAMYADAAEFRAWKGSTSTSGDSYE